ncbi:MAG TPA: hypothetical protein VK911_13260, partial [Vicinamibacterales bacterium]|nr:hypothetical protein [Vicinamibacterales bacterium]
MKPAVRVLLRSLLVFAAAASVAATDGQTPGSSAAPVVAQALPSPAPPLPMARQIAIREGWLARRHQMLLPMMRAHKI